MTGRRLLVFAGTLWLACASVGAALAGCDIDLNGVAYGNCPSGGGGGYRAPRAYRPPPPTRAEIAAQRAYALNQQGVALDFAKNYAAAADYYGRAAALTPNDPVILRNLAGAQNRLGLDAFNNGDYTGAMNYLRLALAHIPPSDPGVSIIRASIAAAQERIDSAQALNQQMAQYEQQDKAATATMQQTLQGLAQSVTAGPAPSSKGLGFGDNAGGDKPGGSGGLTFMVPGGPATDRGAFGSRVARANFATLHDNLVTPSDFKAGDQLRSAAATASDPRGDLRVNYDRGGAANVGSLPVTARSMGQTPAAAQFSAHIPDAARTDPQIQQSVAYYQKLDVEKIDAQTQLAAIQQKIKAGDGDSQLLKAQGEALSGAVQRYTADQATTQAQVQSQLKKIGVSWNESPPPAKTPQTATP